MRQIGRLAACVVGAAVMTPALLLTFWQFMAAGVLAGGAGLAVLGGLLLPIVWGLVLAHELGHVAGGSAVGLPFHSLVVPFLTVAREGRRLRARPNSGKQWPIGFVRYGWTPGPTWRWAVFAAAGPAANLLLAGGLFAAAAAVHHLGPPARPSPADPHGLRRLALVFPSSLPVVVLNLAGLSSVYLAVGSLVPGTARRLQTDGAQIVHSLRGIPPRLHVSFNPSSTPARAATLSPAPDVLAEAEDVAWSADARQLLDRAATEAATLGDPYVGTRHLLLAAVANGGLDYAAVRAAVVSPVRPPAVEGQIIARWPTPRLRRAVAQAAMRSIAHGRPVSRQDIWHALLTDPDSDARPVLDALGVDTLELFRTLANGRSCRRPPNHGAPG